MFLPDVVDTAISVGNFNTLVTAIKAAGLEETLKGPGPFTVFAPLDDAFSKLPKGEVVELLKDKPKLKSILTYHVVQGKFLAADMPKVKKLKTIEGEDVKIDSAKWHGHKNFKVNDADVIKTDIIVDNGVCHAINKVLMPKMQIPV